MTATYAEVCAGYDGLGKAVAAVFGAAPLWFSEFEDAPSRVLAHHYPDVPNHGDMTKIDWATVEPPTILSGGTPCQDLSAAGRRRGMTEGTRSNLWVQMREAIATLQPEWVVWENVRGAYSATADSELESCPGCVGSRGGDGGSQPALRALGRVLGDLSDLGYDTEWRGLRASDIGACHHRFRVFVLAHRRDADPEGVGWGKGRSESARLVWGSELAIGRGQHLPPPNAAVSNDGEGVNTWTARRDAAGAHTGMPLTIAVQTLPTPGANIASNGGSQHPEKRRAGGHQPSIQDVAEFQLFPTPRATRGGSATETVDLLGTPRTANGMRNDLVQRINPHGRLEDQIAYVPTPSVADTQGGHKTRSGKRSGELLLNGAAEYAQVDWGKYLSAVQRHEEVFARTAPAPTTPNPKTGNPQLNPVFVEWMMGQPEGWVTDPRSGRVAASLLSVSATHSSACSAMASSPNKPPGRSATCAKPSETKRAWQHEPGNSEPA